MSLPVVPAIIPTSAVALRDALKTISFALEVHIDVVDGVFVPHTSWPYAPTGDPAEVKDALDGFTLEVDLMVHEPLPAAGKWLTAGADMLVFHVETIAPTVLGQFASSTKATVGIAAHLSTPLPTLLTYLPHADYVQVMGIGAIGAQGAPFDDRALTRLAELKAAHPELLLSVDGSVNEATLPRLRDVGAGRFIVGSAIMAAESPAAVHFELSGLTESRR
jgi:ribulose-phosphate 3-epimerase